MPLPENVNGPAGDQSPAGRPPQPEKPTAPAATIIVPCYNCMETLDETLESLQNQTFKDFEVVCVNDGSTDATPEILERWRDKGAFTLRILDQPNGGVSRARNHAIDEARGECILFLDADDIFHPRFVECMLAGLCQADVAYCRLERDLSRLSFTASSIDFRREPMEVAMKKLMYDMGRYGFYCYAYRKATLDQFAVRFDENTKYGEDREFIWKYLCHCRSFAWIDAPLYGYRLNPHSASITPHPWNIDLLKAVKRLEAYLENCHCPFSGEFNSYMFARCMMTTAKRLACNRSKPHFDALLKTYDVKSCMEKLTRNHDKRVAFFARLYLIHPKLFYWVLYLHG